VRGNPQALFGKRPTEKDPAKGTSPAVDFTREGLTGNGPVATPAPRLWVYLTSPGTRFADLGPDYYASRTDKDKKIRNHIHQLQALGLTVTVAPAA